MNRNIIDHSTAGGASWGSPLAPGSFYLVANLREINRTKTETKNHLHSYLYKTLNTHHMIACGALIVLLPDADALNFNHPLQVAQNQANELWYFGY